MRDRLRLLFRFDAEAMRRELDNIDSTVWTEHFVTRNYEGSWTVVPLRAPAGAQHPIEKIYADPSADRFVDTPFLQQSPYFRQVLAQFQCTLQSVRLMRLTPGSVIRPHADHDLGAEQGKVRLHVPIVTNAEVDFRLNGRRVVMREGECWYLRLSDPHTVSNPGATDRVHLVIDATLNSWLEQQLSIAERSPQPEEPAEDVREQPSESLDGWIPFRMRRENDRDVVDWCHLGVAAFTEPFFEQTVGRALAGQRDRAYQTTPIEALRDVSERRPGIPPTAFIFHVSRCGSTLFSQLAAALPGTVVISEAPPIDSVIRSPETDAVRIERLQWLLGALGQRRRGGESHFFVKFDAWHALDLPLIRRAFPDTRFVFLYREPAEVIASQMRMSGMQMVPGVLDPSLFGLDLDGVLQLERSVYCARVLALLYSAGVEYRDRCRLTLINYVELPDAATRMLFEWCGVTADDEIRARLKRVIDSDAKTPSLPFDRDEAAIRQAPDARAIASAHRFVTPYYDRLEIMRRESNAILHHSSESEFQSH